MPQQHLQGAQVGPVVEQMGGKTVAQAVRADLRRGNTRQHRIALDQDPERLPAQRITAGGDKQRGDRAGVFSPFSSILCYEKGCDSA